MPAVSEGQRRAAAIALRAKRGEFPKSRLGPAALAMFEGMSEKQLQEFVRK